MDDSRRSIAKLVNNGQYFQDALCWYNVRYLSPLIDRSTMVLMFLLLIISMIISSSFLFSLSFADINVLFISKLDDITRNYSVIKSLSKNSESSETSIIKYLAKNYLIVRESYSYDDIKNQIYYIKNNSSPEVFRIFYNDISIDNPNSPILQYQKNINRSINILSVESDPKNVDTIHIKFNALLNNTISGEKTSTKWISTIKYTMSPIYETISSRKYVLDFVVHDYKLKKIN